MDSDAGVKHGLLCGRSGFRGRGDVHGDLDTPSLALRFSGLFVSAYFSGALSILISECTLYDTGCILIFKNLAWFCRNCAAF